MPVPDRAPTVFAIAMQEIYIRNATEIEARGPFSAQQIADLAEAGQVTFETFIYDGATEQWVALNTNAELMSVVFPKKKKLVLKAKEIKILNKLDANAKAITVDDILAAAEGRTDDTKGKFDPEIDMMKAAKIGRYGALATLVANPLLRLAVVCDAEGDPVPVAVAIRDKGTCEVLIPAARFDPFGLLELVGRHGGTVQ